MHATTTTHHPLSCQCGALQGRVALKGLGNHLICHCRDCQAFARYLGRAEAVLDGQGGSEIVQVTPDRIEITQGQDHLAAMRLSPKGLVRWYAACCRTPLGNTLPSRKLPFVGLLHSCLRLAPLEPSFGPVKARFSAESALGEPRPVDQGKWPVIARTLRMIAACRLSGRYRRTPFFNEQDTPVAVPEVVDAGERQRLRLGPSA